MSLLIVIVYTEYGQWQASFIQEKLACFTEVRVTEQILQKFPNSKKSLGTENVYQALFSLPTHKRLLMRIDTLMHVADWPHTRSTSCMHATACCFNHTVVTLVVAELKRQQLCIVYLLIA